MGSYLVPVGILAAAVAAFFAAARGRYARFGLAQSILRMVAALPLLLSALFLHFMRTNEATAMLPPIFPAPAFPSPRFLVIATGILEILGAAGLFVAAVRRGAALWVAIMMVMIFPVNVFVAGQTFGGLQMPSVHVRLAMQAVYIWMVLLAGWGLPGFGESGRR